MPWVGIQLNNKHIYFKLKYTRLKLCPTVRHSHTSVSMWVNGETSAKKHTFTPVNDIFLQLNKGYNYLKMSKKLYNLHFAIMKCESLNATSWR